MTHVHFQPVGGAAGDMTLASLVAAGVPLQEIVATLRGLGVAFDVATERVEVSGVGALRARFTARTPSRSPSTRSAQSTP